MKDLVKNVVQRAFGFDNYLFVFSLFKILTLRIDRRERDFFFFLRLIPDDGIILDVGANVGVMATHLSRRRPNCVVHCFEPIEDNFRTLARIRKLFRLHNASLHPMALGDAAGRANMLMPSRNEVRFQGLSHVVEAGAAAGTGRTYEVDMERLDNLEVARGPRPIVAMKIDVEGFEHDVLRGSETVLRRDRPLVYCELWANEKRNSCLAFMDDLGYDVLVRGRCGLAPLRRESARTQNVFFVPSKRR